MAPKVSIIVPVYNAQKYLGKCLNSLRRQTFKDFELILVDDCSTDKSARICDKYAKKDARIKVIHKPVNEKTGLAEKTGLDIARGDYVWMINNDDWAEPYSLEEMYAAAVAGDYDILCCDFYYDYPKETVLHRIDQDNQDKKEIIGGFLSWIKYYPFLWSKLIKRDVYNQVTFLPIVFAEDRCTCIQAFLYAKSIFVLHKAFYHWKHYTGSSSHKLDRTILNITEDYDSYIAILFAFKKVNGRDNVFDNIFYEDDFIKKNIMLHLNLFLQYFNLRFAAAQIYHKHFKELFDLVKNNNDSSDSAIVENRNSFVAAMSAEINKVDSIEPSDDCISSTNDYNETISTQKLLSDHGIVYKVINNVNYFSFNIYVNNKDTDNAIKIIQNNLGVIEV